MKTFNCPRIFCFILLAVLAGVSRAQNYIPLPLQNCYWLIYNTWGSSDANLQQTCSYFENYKIFSQNDTIINSTRYIKFYSQYLNGGGGTLSGPPCTAYSAPTTTLNYSYCVRQDTLNRKLYMVYPNSTVEKLMFDFTQWANDTIKAECGSYASVPPGGTTQYRIIDSVYYRSYNDGQCHKVYKLKPFANSVGLTSNTEVIEGYGNETGLIIKTKSASSGSWGVTNFQSYGNATLVINSSTLAATVNTCQGVGLKENNHEEVNVFPNPVKDNLYISVLGKNVTGAEIYSCTGQKLTVNIQRQDNYYSVSLTNLPSGYYYIKIVTINQTYFKKIIKVNS